LCVKDSEQQRKYCMLPEKELIEELLRLQMKQTQKFESVKDLMIYQRGFLTGLLSQLAHDDSYVRQQLHHRLKLLNK
jgi:hypothetical protein